MALIATEITQFYLEASEESRLQFGLGPLEFERNKELIARYLPVNGLIADVGGGTGHYAHWLSGLGHEVVLIDPVSKHIQQAEKRSRKSKFPFRCLLGESRALPLADHSVDLVILHGPLYHLLDAADRIAALGEAGRVLRAGGVVLGFAITYAAFTLAGLQNGLIHHQQVFAMCKQELLSGEHYPPADFPGMLAQAYFHRPSVFIKEFEAAGFKPLSLLAVEGIAWLDQHYFESWSTPEKKQQLLALVRQTEADEELLCLSPHMMLAAKMNEHEA